MPCVCWNGRIIRCAEGNRVSHDVQKTILHPVFRGIVYEHVEAFAAGPHVHACQSHSSPRLIAESPFVDPPAVDGRQTIDDASTDCEFRVGGQFREMNRGYGKLFHRPAAADAEIVSAVHAAADCDLAVRVEGQGSMLLVHTFQQYRAFIFRQETGVHRLMHNLAVGIDVGCEGRVAKSERHHADFGEMYRHAVWPMPDLPFKGYGKLADWVCDGSGALLATACRTEVSNSDDTVRLNNQHSRGLTVGHAAHAVDFNRRPILSRQNVLALFRIPTASTNRAAELHEYQRSGFDDGEPFAVVQGYGKLLLRVEDVDSHGDAIAQRRAAGVPCDKLKSFCRMTVRNHRDVVERRHFVFSVVHQL